MRSTPSEDVEIDLGTRSDVQASATTELRTIRRARKATRAHKNPLLGSNCEFSAEH